MANSAPIAPSPPSWWPIAIIGAFAVFLTACVSFIIYSSFHKVDLVTRDYYAQELRHQEQMERVARTQGVQARLRISFDAGTRRVVIALPPEHVRQSPTGKVHLYRPSAAGLDRQLALELDAAGVQALDASGLEPGLWRVKVTWSVAGQQYYFDQKLVIPPPKS